MFTFVYQLSSMTLPSLKHWFKTYKESQLFGRYIFGDHVLPLIEKHKSNFRVDCIGQSVLKNDIHVITIGNGKTKILMWSQMHGNESTTTKAVFDLCNLFAFGEDKTLQIILKSCTIAIVPMLNPDGARAYTRVNANDIDLNRDAQDLSQPESKVLRAYFDDFNPDYCFNLHGQRTIFSAGSNNKPATVSFLAPAQDEACTVTPTRKKAMEVIVAMTKNLQKQIPNQIGIYDDAFNINCVGDTFQSHDKPTILFEAGHFANDYNREVVREFIFQSLIIAINYIAKKPIGGSKYEAYFAIPKNEKLFYDFIIRKAKVNAQVVDVAIQCQEQLVGNNIVFVPIVESISNLDGFFGHKEIDAKEYKVLVDGKKELEVGNEIDFVTINTEKFALVL